MGQNPELIHPSHRSLNSLRRRPRRRSPRRRRPHAAVAYAAAAHAAAAHATAARDAAARVTEARVTAARAAAVRAAAARAAAITLARATTAHGRNSRRSSPHRHSPRQRSPRRHRPHRRSPRLSQPANSKPAPPEPTPPPLAAASPAGQRVATTSGELSLPPLQWSGPKPRVAGPAWPGASVADLSTKLEPFFRARPPHKFSSAGRRHARPAAGAEKNQAPRQTADFIKKLGHLARVPACCAGQHLQHLVQLAASAALSAQRQLAKHTDCSVDLLAPRSGALKRCGCNACTEVHGRLSCETEASDRSTVAWTNVRVLAAELLAKVPWLGC